ncbi:hypothetical protein FOCC_FOCC016393 [Frankliniella occidentalis]|nr:hypothetical protein FOCC_FOCC016393 [Frankliniella occidentalis]
MDQIKPLVPGDDLEAQWKYLKWQFDGYILFDAARSAWTPENKAKALMHFIGLDCAYLFESALAATKKDIVLLTAHIDEQVKPVTNACFERYQFRKLVRKEGEDINHFVSRCRSKLANCGLPAGFSSDFMIMDALVHPLTDSTLQRHFFQTKDLKLEKVIEDLKIHEAGQDQIREIQSCRSQLNALSIQSKKANEVHFVKTDEAARRTRGRSRSSSAPRSVERRPRSRSSSRSKGKPSRSNQRHPRSRSSSRSKSGDRNARRYRTRSPTPGPSRVSTGDDSECQNCGYSHGDDWCPARDKKCHTCGRLGHFAYKCQSE